MSSIQLGVIGTGVAAKVLHWPALKRIPELFTIPVVCNHTLPKAEEFAELIGGAQVVTDYRELLADPAIEAVLITAPIDLNLELTSAALAAGKHVLVEKPLAVNLEQCNSMLELADTNPELVTMVAENYRYRKAIIAAKGHLDKGTIGEVYAVHYLGMGHMELTNKYASPWRLAHQYPGGYVTDAGVHDMATLRSLLDGIQILAAQVGSGNPDIGAIDSLSMQFEASGGVIGSYSRYFTAVGQAIDRHIILGRNGSLSLENNRLTINELGRDLKVESFEDRGYQEQLRAFHGAIQNGLPVLSTFEEAFKDLELLINAYNLAAPGQSLTA